MTDQADVLRRKGSLPDWFKLHVDWYLDEVLRVAAKRHRDVLVVWPIVVAMAKKASGPDNLDGVVSTSVDALAEFALTETDAVVQVLDVLVEGELIEVESGRLGTVKIRLTRFNKWQTARKTEADKKQRQRHDASREKASDCPPSVPDVSPTRPLDKTRQDKTRQGNELSSTNDDGSRPSGPDHARDLFRYWIEATGRSENQNRLTRGRRSKVNARMRDGFTVDQLRDAIDGIASSAWHAGDNPNSKRYDTFDLIMRSAETVERGIDYAAKDRSTGSGPGVDENATRRAYRDMGYTDDAIDEIIDRQRKGTAA